jgi:hypothetical protein
MPLLGHNVRASQVWCQCFAQVLFVLEDDEFAKRWVELRPRGAHSRRQQSALRQHGGAAVVYNVPQGDRQSWHLPAPTRVRTRAVSPRARPFPQVFVFRSIYRADDEVPAHLANLRAHCRRLLLELVRREERVGFAPQVGWLASRRPAAGPPVDSCGRTTG